MTKSDDPIERNWVKILTFVVIISLSANALLFINRTEVFPKKRALISQNKELDKKLTSYQNELNKYRGISLKIDEAVSSGNAKIQELEKQLTVWAKKNKLKDKENEKLMFQLDSVNEQYLEMIDSLLVERENNKLINTKIEDLEETIAELNKKVGLGSFLIGDNLKVNPVKKTFRDKKQYTALAKKVQEFEVCIDVMENKIAKAGVRKVYFVLTSPNAKVLVDGEGDAPTFQHVVYKTTAECSKIESINYKNQKVNLCTTIKVNTPIESGTYVLEVFLDENKLAMTTFSLK